MKSVPDEANPDFNLIDLVAFILRARLFILLGLGLGAGASWAFFAFRGVVHNYPFELEAPSQISPQYEAALRERLLNGSFFNELPQVFQGGASSEPRTQVLKILSLGLERLNATKLRLSIKTRGAMNTEKLVDFNLYLSQLVQSLNETFEKEHTANVKNERENIKGYLALRKEISAEAGKLLSLYPSAKAEDARGLFVAERSFDPVRDLGLLSREVFSYWALGRLNEKELTRFEDKLLDLELKRQALPGLELTQTYRGPLISELRARMDNSYQFYSPAGDFLGRSTPYFIVLGGLSGMLFGLCLYALVWFLKRNAAQIKKALNEPISATR